MAGDRRGVVAHAIDDAGNAVALQEQQLAAARDNNFTPISASEAATRAQADADANYVDQNYGTTGKLALGALDGLSLGLAPALGVRTGMLDAGHLDAARQSGAYTAGDVAGTLLPAFLSGGTSLEAGAAKGVVGKALAATPAGMMNAAGGLTERLVGRLLPEAGLLGKTATASLKMAARGATEGALMNVAHEASNDIILNKPLTAQALLASAEDGALFGGLAGGILGGGAALAGHGVESLGNRAVAGVAGQGGERSAGVAIERLGLKGKMGELAEREGRFVGAVRQYQDVLQKAETSFAAPTSAIRANTLKLVEEQEAVAADALRELGLIQKPGRGPIQQLASRMEKEYMVMYRGTADQQQARRIYESLGARLNNATEWEHWAANREILANEAKKAQGLKKNIYESALNAFDDEFRLAGSTVDEALFKQYAAATTTKRIGQEIVEGTTGKLAEEASRGNPLHLNPVDGATGAMGVIMGNPLGAAGIVLSRKLTGYAQQKLEPIIAEYAARAAIGSSAGAATVNVGARLSGALKNFMTGARVSTERAHAEGRAPKKLSYSMKAYEEQMKLVDQLTSAAHQAKVREHTEALAMAGHEELATELQNTYGRAVAYINANKPRGRGDEYAAGSLGKTPKAMSLDTQGWRFMRIVHSALDPVGTVVSGLKDGSLSRDAISAIKYVMPDLHQELVVRASQEVMAMKAEGKFLPADKEALLGVALDYPVSSKLQKDFIAEVQQGLAANKKPPPDGGQSPPPVTDISSYQTPLQSSV